MQGNDLDCAEACLSVLRIQRPQSIEVQECVLQYCEEYCRWLLCVGVRIIPTIIGSRPAYRACFRSEETAPSTYSGRLAVGLHRTWHHVPSTLLASTASWFASMPCLTSSHRSKRDQRAASLLPLSVSPILRLPAPCEMRSSVAEPGTTGVSTERR